MRVVKKLVRDYEEEAYEELPPETYIATHLPYLLISH